jgi:chloramphenicol O-acetyltransferase type A
MQYIDMDRWSRKEHFDFFYKMDYPQFNVSMNLDVTNFLQFVKEHHLSFYYAMIFASTYTANQIVDFRYRIRGDKVVLHDKVNASFTDIMKDSDLFKMVMVEMSDEIIAFTHQAKEQSEKQKEFIIYENAEERDDLLYFTCVPWFSYTQLTHPIALSREDSVPKIAWGKYFREGDKVMLPFSIQANHALMDGIHVGRYIEKLQGYLNHLTFEAEE